LGVQLQPSGRSHSRGNRTERANGIFFEEIKRTRLSIVADLRRGPCIDGLILGGNKRACILHAGDAPGVPFRGTTRICVHRAARELLRSRRTP
jgi:hypothetical protein